MAENFEVDEPQQDTDPFTEFGGKKISAPNNDPFAEFGGRIIKKKADGNVSANGGLNTPPLPSISAQNGSVFADNSFFKQIGQQTTPELQQRHDEINDAVKRVNTPAKTPLQKFDQMATPFLQFGRDVIGSVNPKKVAEINHDIDGHWGNIVQNVFAKLEKTGTDIAAGTLSLINDAEQLQNPVKTDATPMGELIAGLNGNKKRMQAVIDNNPLPNTFLGNTVSSLASIAPDIAGAALLPEAKIAQGTGVLAKAGGLFFNKFTNYLMGKGAVTNFGEAKEQGKSTGEAAVQGIKGGLEGAKQGIELALLGAGSGLATKSIMASAEKAGLVGEKALATRQLVNLSTDLVAYGLVQPTVNAAEEGRFPTMKEIADGAGIAAAFRLKGGLEEFKDHSKLNKAIEETQNQRQGVAIANFVDADHDAIKQVYDQPETAQELNLKALEAAKKAKETTDLTKKQEYVAQAITFTKASNVKSVADMVLNNPEGLKDFENSDLPEPVKQQFLQKAQEVKDILSPKSETNGNQETDADAQAKEGLLNQTEGSGTKQPEPSNETPSTVKSEGGSIFHGTSKEAADFIEKNGFDVTKAADGSIWFTNDKSKIEKGEVGASTKGGIIERQIDESKLKLGGWDDQDKYSTDELIAKGYDGLKLEENGETTYQIFHPEKLSKVLKNETTQDTKQAEKEIAEPSKLSEDKQPTKSNKGVIKKATSIEDLTEPRDIVLQHFVAGGKIHSDAIKELFGGKDDRIRQNASTENEKRARIGLLSKEGKGIDELAHSLWEADETGKYTAQDYKNAIEQVLQDHNSTGSMARELVDKYIDNGKSELTDAELKEVDETQQKKINKQLENLDDKTQEELFTLLQKYQDKHGNIDWEKLNEDTNGFDIDILNLSENSQKQLYELINSKLEGQDELSDTNIKGESSTQQETSDNNSGNEPPTTDLTETNTDEGGGNTGIKNKVSNETRTRLYLPKVEVPKLGKDVEILHQGKKLVGDGTIDPQEVVNRIISTDNHNMSRDEAKAMQYYMHQLGRAQDLVNEQLSKEIEPQERLELISQQQQLSDLQDAATEANIKAGKDWSDVGNIRQILVGKSFNPSRERAIIKEAYGGEVPREVKEKLDATIKERDEAIAQRTKLEEQLRESEAKLKIAEMKKGSSKGEKKDHKANRAALIDELKAAKEEHEKWLKDNGIQKQGISGFTLTPKMVKIVGKIAAEYVQEGYEKLEDIVNKVYEEVKSILPGIDKKDIRDSMALYESDKLNEKGEKLEKKITDNDIQSSKPKLKVKFEKNTEWVKANQRVINAEYKIRKLKNEALNSQKNAYQKGLMWASKLIRASVLSGTNVLYKLASAATLGGAGKRIAEQSIGQVYANVFRGIAEKAPIEGFTNAKSEAKFYKEFFNPKKFIKNSWQILKSGASDLTKKMDGRMNDDLAEITLPGKQTTFGGKIAKGALKAINKTLEFPTDLHMVIKEPLKRATFEASVRNGMVWAEKNGLDINDPLVINSIENAAYKRANYEIFQEENALSKRFNSWKSKMDKGGNVAATGKLLADFMIPVSTVPTNIVKRIFSTSPLGLIRGGYKVTQAYRRGIENLSSEEADAVMRQLKQGTLGTALWLTGWFAASHFGGLYSKYDPNKKRQEGELTSDEMEVNGQMIPKPVQHALPLEIIQTAATARHIYDNYRDNKGSGNFEALSNAALGSIGALSEHVPIVSTAGLALEAGQDPYKGEKLKEDMQRRFEPQILRETGVIGTKNNPRQHFIERNTKDGGLFRNDVKVYDQQGKERSISTEEFEKFKDKREELIKERLNKLYDGKDATNLQLDKTGNVVSKKYDDMTEKELLSAIASIKTKAYKDAKVSVFGKQSMSHEERRADKRLNKARKIN